VGAQVDGVFFAYNGEEPLPIDDILDRIRFQDGTRAFQLKMQEKQSLPHNKWNLQERKIEIKYEPARWTELSESDIPDVTSGVEIAKHFDEKGGLLLSGPAGVGKGYVLR